jgi:oligopeptide transport system ATP-binding protein
MNRIVEPVLEVRNLKTRFYTRDGVVKAVNGISYRVNRGEVTAIVGESGSGKSVGVLSALRLIPEPPGKIESGEALLEGVDLLKLPKEALRKKRGNTIAMIFQDPMTSLNPVLTIGRQMTESILAHKDVSRQEARQRSIEMLSLVGIGNPESRLKDYAFQFSGGMRQRVMIAMGLACSPKVLIADEPTTALDVTIQAQIVTLMEKIQSEMGMGVIWITHDLGIVAGFSKDVVVMYGGYIVEKAPVELLFGNPYHPYTVGLLKSLPRLDTKVHVRLKSIPGAPPDMVNLPAGCPFLERCAQKMSQCAEVNPVLIEKEPEHEVACLKYC